MLLTGYLLTNCTVSLEISLLLQIAYQVNGAGPYAIVPSCLIKGTVVLLVC